MTQSRSRTRILNRTRSRSRILTRGILGRKHSWTRSRARIWIRTRTRNQNKTKTIPRARPGLDAGAGTPRP